VKNEEGGLGVMAVMIHDGVVGYVRLLSKYKGLRESH